MTIPLPDSSPAHDSRNAMKLNPLHEGVNAPAECKHCSFSHRQSAWVQLPNRRAQEAVKVITNSKTISSWVSGRGVENSQEIFTDSLVSADSLHPRCEKNSYNSTGRLFTVCKILNLPKDPALWTEAHCETFLIEGMKSDWFNLRRQFSPSNAEGTAVLERMVDFRKCYVDTLISRLSQQYRGIQAFSVGSQDLSSDYDLTLGMAGELKQDVQAVRAFNEAIQNAFGKPSGIAFDVNMYVQDHITLSENIDAKRVGTPIPGSERPGLLMRGMALADQDVMALMKQRRFMQEDEWGAYVECLMSKIKDPMQKDRLRKQYEEADANYKISVFKILESLKVQGIKFEDPLLSEAEELRVRNFAQKLAPNLSTSLKENAVTIFREELLNIYRMAIVLENYPNQLLEVCNQLYLDNMQAARDLQTQIKKLKGNDTRTIISQTEVLKAQVKRAMGEALFFAHEAYQSEGAVLHIVIGSQGGRLKEMAEKLLPGQILHSHNEQLGDFLKNIQNHLEAGASEGVLCYRSSKYLSRLLETVMILKDKGILETLDFEKEYGAIEELKERIDSGLLQIRKGKLDFSTEAQKDLYALQEMQEIFQITPEQDLAEILKKRILALALEINAVTRMHPSYRVDDPDQESERLYFQKRMIK